MGTIIGSAVVPIALCITWKKCNGNAAVVGAISGFIAGVGGWIGITSKLNDGVVNVETTFGDYEMLTGNLLAIGVGGLVTVGYSLWRPENFDWDITREINKKGKGEGDAERRNTSTVVEEVGEGEGSEKDVGVKGQNGGEKEKEMTVTGVLVYERDEPNVEARLVGSIEGVDESEVGLQRAFRLASWAALSLTVILIFVSTNPCLSASHLSY
jgi:hypothetical protein